MNRFFRLHFTGGRYDEQLGVPLAALPGLAKFERLVRSVARDLFFDGNEERKRVSPGFDAAFVPAITRIEGGGSADCDVSWTPNELDANATYFEAAQTEIVELLEVFRRSSPTVPPWLSRESAQHLADVLEAIEEGEAMGVEATAGEEVIVTFAERERVQVEASKSRPAQGEPFQVVGRLHRIADDPWAVGVFVWETRRSITVPVPQRLKPQITAAWEQNERTLVRLVGTANRDAQGYRRFVDASDIRIIAGPPLTARTEELAAVKDGWLNDETEARVPTRRFLVSIERGIWGIIEQLGVDRPYLFLMPECGVEAVWKTERHTVSLRFLQDAAGHVEVVSVNREASTVQREGPSTLDEIQDWLAKELGVVG